MRSTPPRKRRPGTASFDGLRKLIQKVERTLNERIDRLHNELESIEPALAAAKLRALNEIQTIGGVSRLRQELKAQQDAGIIDAQGRRIREGLPADMLGGTSDVV